MRQQHLQENKHEDLYAPYKVYKSDISYFSGKLEAYMRYKEMPYEPVDTDWFDLNEIIENTGFKKMPAVKMANGQWLYDTTPMLQWFEQHYSVPSILPADSALRFITLLLEDYADEWLWRPAMWWRWIPRATRWALGWRIAADFLSRPLARPLGWYFGKRQSNEWLWGDGMTRQNSETVRDMLFREFEFLEPQLETQPFLVGSHPSAADFGYFASMFRHFGNDPAPAEVMRRQAPNTYQWLARMWNAKTSKLSSSQQWIWPKGDHWEPLLSRIANDYLPYLHQNALAHEKGQKRFNHIGATFQFNNTKTTVYRVWCREVLQQEYNSLISTDKQKVDELFEPVGGLSALEKDGVIKSGIAERFQLPFDPHITKPVRQSIAQFLFGQPRN